MNGHWTAAVLAAALLGGAAAAAIPGEEAPAPRIEDLAWLAGGWKVESHSGSFEEFWLPPLAGTMAAVSRQVRDGKLSMYEMSVIETAADGSLALRLLHLGAGLVPMRTGTEGPMVFRVKETGKGRVVFEDPDRPFPRRVVYALGAEEGTMTAVLEPAEGVERKPVEFRFRRFADLRK